MRRRLMTLLVVVVGALALASPSLGDGGWGAGGNCSDMCSNLKP
jgi:hypothetical protein